MHIAAGTGSPSIPSSFVPHQTPENVLRWPRMARGVITFLISTLPQVLCHLPGRHDGSQHMHHFTGPMTGHHHSLDHGVIGAAFRVENRSLPEFLRSHQFDELGHKPLRSESTILLRLCVITRVRIINLGWSFLASKVPSHTPYLSPWWTNLSEIWYTYDLIRVIKHIKKFC